MTYELEDMLDSESRDWEGIEDPYDPGSYELNDEDTYDGTNPEYESEMSGDYFG